MIPNDVIQSNRMWLPIPIAAKRKSVRSGACRANR